MFLQRCLGRKKKQTTHENIVLDEKKQHSVAQRSVAVPVTPAAAEAGKGKKTKWRNHLFGHLEKKESTSSDVQTPAPEAQKTSWWLQLFKCCRRSRQVAPAADSRDEKRNSPNPRRRHSGKVNGTHRQDEHGHSSSFSHQDPVTPFTSSMESLDDLKMADFMDFSSLKKALLEEQLNSTKLNDNGVEGGPVDLYGFPNIGQSCYMNSSLQSLLMLEDFIRDISRAEKVWSSTPEAQLMRGLMEIRDVHTSTHPQTKTSLLRAFKDAVSVQAPEFRDPLQKDAHEFLTSVLDQMRSLNPLLQEAAARTGRSYTCPVEDHLVFRMENSRTCRSCGAQSTRQEEFTNLCLDLLPGGSVEDLLQEYLKETELEFSCECGGKTSGRSSSFVTLPQVLILQLKRFRFSPSFELEKADDAVTLLRDLVVSSRQGGGCFSLVSAISHFGGTEAGHYICDGVHPDDSPDEPTDRWLRFDDSMVSETTGSTVCDEQQREAYILFYKRQV